MPKAELVYRPAKQSEKAEAGDYEHLCPKKETLAEMLKNIELEKRFSA